MYTYIYIDTWIFIYSDIHIFIFIFVFNYLNTQWWAEYHQSFVHPSPPHPNIYLQFLYICLYLDINIFIYIYNMFLNPVMNRVPSEFRSSITPSSKTRVPESPVGGDRNSRSSTPENTGIYVYICINLYIYT
jgi:hypothetical protein